MGNLIYKKTLRMEHITDSQQALFTMGLSNANSVV